MDHQCELPPLSHYWSDIGTEWECPTCGTKWEQEYEEMDDDGGLMSWERVV